MHAIGRNPRGLARAMVLRDMRCGTGSSGLRGRCAAPAGCRPVRSSSVRRTAVRRIDTAGRRSQRVVIGVAAARHRYRGAARLRDTTGVGPGCSLDLDPAEAGS
ncbi:Hypothetical protein I596_1250 [Dokdonella koreensis DS-123]|uniref:Uncharacterized protein n=1 Tax=Dokdonella koreensis DS-123 TaxID=1300342 RepID=A0A160DTH9_9GAMM|nr:Hypothetical protein I596_1250 [Dokdonella koreensis DS-123]